MTTKQKTARRKARTIIGDGTMTAEKFEQLRNLVPFDINDPEDKLGEAVGCFTLWKSMTLHACPGGTVSATDREYARWQNEYVSTNPVFEANDIAALAMMLRQHGLIDTAEYLATIPKGNFEGIVGHLAVIHNFVYRSKS